MDSIVALRLLAPADQQAAARFFDQHRKMGHSPEPAARGLRSSPEGLNDSRVW